MTIAEIFESRKNNPRWNTSYPINPKDWDAYRVAGPLSFEKDRRLSFYIHIPFCKQLCSFCEYARMICPDENLQKNYLLAIANDINQFKRKYTDIKLLGFDIGGGTPTSLSEKNFSLLLQIYNDAISGLNVDVNYEPSIEGTFNTLSESKLDEICKNGFHRLSLGVQSSCSSVLRKHRRTESSESIMSSWMAKAWKIGVKKVNLDFMYGLNGQNVSSICQDIELIARLKPQQVTLYELRPNMIAAKDVFSKEELYEQYAQYYNGLIALGYKARFGQNTFSVDAFDEGVSSYLRQRMLNGEAYKGFGIAAQSMNSVGLSYNIGKMSNLTKSLLACNSYQEEYTYLLPQNELIAKYMAISAYHGSFSIERLVSMGANEEHLNEILDFCFSQKLLSTNNDNKRICITPKGFVYYGALFSLFCSK
ncbi:MAG: radical SAM protein [Bacteroidales bacterium]|nr:radical SAM protein [Bacteroidales bacterium]